MRATALGTFVFSWNQVEVDGVCGTLPSEMVAGAAWRWTGEALRVEDMQSVLVLTSGQDEVRARAARHIQKLIQSAPDMTAGEEDTEAPANSFDLTDGLGLFHAIVLDVGSGRAPLVVFKDRLPPQGQDLWVIRQEVKAAEPKAADGGMLCFVPGTLITTARGDVPVEELDEMDQVQTADNGFQPVLMATRSRVSGGRILAMPKLRPVRISAATFGVDVPNPDLYVSPDHRILIRGAEAQALFNTPECLVAARDLVGMKGVRVDHRIRAVEYIHLALDGHQIVRANGVDCESFHPALAATAEMASAHRSKLENLFPGVIEDPMIFGQFARRMVTQAEAAIWGHSIRI